MPQTVVGNYTFADGTNKSLRAIILSIRAAQGKSSEFPLGVNWSARVESGGPVATGSSAMAALTDGRQMLITDSDSPNQFDDSTQIYFRPTIAGDVISVRASSRN
jgi:hypothetical protein